MPFEQSKINFPQLPGIPQFTPLADPVGYSPDQFSGYELSQRLPGTEHPGGESAAVTLPASRLFSRAGELREMLLVSAVFSAEQLEKFDEGIARSCERQQAGSRVCIEDADVSAFRNLLSHEGNAHHFALQIVRETYELCVGTRQQDRGRFQSGTEKLQILLQHAAGAWKEDVLARAEPALMHLMLSKLEKLDRDDIELIFSRAAKCIESDGPLFLPPPLDARQSYGFEGAGIDLCAMSSLSTHAENTVRELTRRFSPQAEIFIRENEYSQSLHLLSELSGDEFQRAVAQIREQSGANGGDPHWPARRIDDAAPDFLKGLGWGLELLGMGRSFVERKPAGTSASWTILYSRTPDFF